MNCGRSWPNRAWAPKSTILFRCTCNPRWRAYGYKAGDFPVSEQLPKEVLALPIFAELTEEEIATVAGLIREFYRRG